MRKTGPTNENLSKLIKELKKLSYSQKTGIWKRVATDLERSTRNRRIVNLNRINKFAKDGESIIVPGKVLGTGDLERKVNVAAFAFSDSCLKKINDAKGKTFTIQEIMKENPSGKNLRIIG